jgi:hypothetical protein
MVDAPLVLSGGDFINMGYTVFSKEGEAKPIVE